MDTDQLVELIPHYIAMLVVVFGVIAVIQAVAGGLGFWIELVIVIVIVFSYRAAVLWLGVGPSRWER